MGAIEFSTSPLILNVFGTYCHVLHPRCFNSYWGLNDFHGRSDINALKHATQRKDFRPSSHQSWSWRPLSSLIFPPPPPSNINVGHPTPKPLRTLPQNQHWWGRGRRNRSKKVLKPSILSSKWTLMREGAAGAAKSSKKLFEPFLKMNIDEGGGGEIV